MSGATTREHESVETIPLQPSSPIASPPNSSPPIASPPISPSPSTAAVATSATNEQATQGVSQQPAESKSRQRSQQNAQPVRSQLSQPVSWRALGCPREIGIYAASGVECDEDNLKIHVKRIHILAAEDDPSALFTVMAFRPPLGPPVFTLGHRVA